MTDTTLTPDQIAEQLQSLAAIIERNLDQLKEVKKNLKHTNESIKNIYENNVELSDAKEKVKEFSDVVKKTKSKLAADPEVVQLKADSEEYKEQKKELEETLSHHLISYYALTNSYSVDTPAGDEVDFLLKAKVKKVKQK